MIILCLAVLLSFFYREKSLESYLLNLKVKKSALLEMKSLKLRALAIALLSVAVQGCKSTDYYEPPTVNGTRGKGVFCSPGNGVYSFWFGIVQE